MHVNESDKGKDYIINHPKLKDINNYRKEGINFLT